MPREWLFLVDLDGTLWDHPDVSSMHPPFKRIDILSLVDSKGERLEVRREILELVTLAHRLKGIVATFSWNEPGKAWEALRVLGLYGLFDYHIVEPHPGKHKMLVNFLSTLKRCRRKTIRAGCIVYMDDRLLHLEELKNHVAGIYYIDPLDCGKPDYCSSILKTVSKTC